MFGARWFLGAMVPGIFVPHLEAGRDGCRPRNGLEQRWRNHHRQLPNALQNT